MSVDSLGRVIVGSGHFADQTPRLMENVSKFMGDERIVSKIQRASTHIEIGVRNAWNSAKRVDQVLGEKLYDLRFPPQQIQPQESRNPFIRLIKNSEKEQRMREKSVENLEKLGEAGLDLLEAFGWGGAGDLESASSKALDAAIKIGGVFLDNIGGPSGD